MHRRTLLLLASALVGCGGGPDSNASFESENIARIELEKQWLLVDDGLAADRDVLRARVELPASYDGVHASVDGLASVQFEHELELPLDGLAPGEHTLVVTDEDGAVLGRASFFLSAPLYVVVSTDWDDTRMSDAFLERMERLRENHPDLKVTQFFAPYHYTDPQISEARRVEIDAWVKKQRDEHGDEIGVHVHGWCHFIDKETNVDCNTQDSFYIDDGSGYTTILAAYSVAEMTEILQASVHTFEERGLGTPTSFRAGGWTADAGTLRALVNAGFSVDSSAVPARWLSSWQGYGLYDWTMQHWAGIEETSQPYYPLESNPVESDPLRGLPILEVPDNGVLVDYVRAEDMIDIYDMNHDGGVLAEPTLYQVGFHPPNFSESFYERMHAALSYVDEHAWSADRGPAVYVNISELLAVWP